MSIKSVLRGVGLSGLSNEDDRIHWVAQTLTNLPAGSRLLDAGCGEQQYRRWCSHLVYVGQDFAQYDGQGDGVGLQTGSWDQSRVDIVSNITSIPEPDASFDAIMCTEVLEHVPDPALAVRELNRLLKPGGFLILTSPFCSLSYFTPYHFSTGFSRYWYESHLSEMGNQDPRNYAERQFFRVHGAGIVATALDGAARRSMQSFCFLYWRSYCR